MGGEIKQKLIELEQQKEALRIEAKQLEEKMVTLSTELSKINAQINNDNSESQQTGKQFKKMLRNFLYKRTLNQKTSRNPR